VNRADTIFSARVGVNQAIIGNCLDVMPKLIDAGVKVQCCVTSPPYWGLRDYGVAGQFGLEPTIQEYVANMVNVFRLGIIYLTTKARITK
jgi:hypothetical protein